MKKISKILFIISLATAFNMKAVAHDPDQISYHFMRFGESAKLEVHFTPAGAFHLIKSLHADLNDSSIIRLSDYMEDFEAYFNKSISLNIANESIGFRLANANLIEHDAVLYFDLTNFHDSFNEFSLSISAFTEIYRNTQNHVTVSGLTILKQFTLNVSNTTYTNKPETAGKKSGLNRTMITVLLLLIAASGFTFHYLRKRQQSFRFINQ